MQSDGSPWRPLVHVEDNHQIRALAAMVERIVPGSTISLAPGASPDKRSYRVSFAKLRAALPALEPRWTVEAGSARHTRPTPPMPADRRPSW
jgi:hypothetical protein